MVPRELKAGVWMHYRPKQEILKDPTPKYLEAARAAIQAVAEREENAD